MKKLLLFLGLISILSFVSCTEDDDSDIKEEVLIGSWQLKSAVLADGTDVTNDCFKKEIINFKTDLTYIDRRIQLDEDTGTCKMEEEFIRGYNIDGDIFETTKNITVIATYKIMEDLLVLDFTIPFEAEITYERIKQ